MELKKAIEGVLDHYYNTYVRQLEEDHDELLAKEKILQNEIRELKKQVSFYKGRCAELEKQPKDEDFEKLEKECKRYREMALKIMKERNDLQERLAGDRKNGKKLFDA